MKCPNGLREIGVRGGQGVQTGEDVEGPGPETRIPRDLMSDRRPYLGHDGIGSTTEVRRRLESSLFPTGCSPRRKMTRVKNDFNVLSLHPLPVLFIFYQSKPDSSPLSLKEDFREGLRTSYIKPLQDHRDRPHTRSGGYSVPHPWMPTPRPFRSSFPLFPERLPKSGSEFLSGRSPLHHSS